MLICFYGLSLLRPPDHEAGLQTAMIIFPVFIEQDTPRALRPMFQGEESTMISVSGHCSLSSAREADNRRQGLAEAIVNRTGNCTIEAREKPMIEKDKG